MNMVLAIAGRMGSGKTTLSFGLCKMFGWPRASFGDYVRREVASRGLAGTRDQLQSIGTELLESDVLTFCRSVLDMSGWKGNQGLILDGFRHVQTIDPLKQLTQPLPFKIVLINVDEKIRRQRLSDRGEGDVSVIERIDAHSSEAQLGSTVEKIADLTVDGAEAPEKLLLQVSNWIRLQGNSLRNCE